MNEDKLRLELRTNPGKSIGITLVVKEKLIFCDKIKVFSSSVCTAILAIYFLI